jgi:acyl carrier protein
MINSKNVSKDERLQDSFRQGLALPPSFDVTRADSASLRQWDSVAHFQLMIAIEDGFGVRLSPGEVVELKSYPAAIAILRRHGAWSDD